VETTSSRSQALKIEKQKIYRRNNIIAEANRKKDSEGKAEEPPVKYKPGGKSKFAIMSTQHELDELRADMERMLKEKKKIILE